jgi:hypothetical protein
MALFTGFDHSSVINPAQVTPSETVACFDRPNEKCGLGPNPSAENLTMAFYNSANSADLFDHAGEHIK